MNGKLLPKKLKTDAIIEALVEIRFDTPPVPELIFGQFAGDPIWKDYQQARLPGADIPAPMRRLDPNLRFQPSFELRNEAEHRLVRLGPQILSYHCLKPYVGWEQFRPEISACIDRLSKYFPALVVRRLGLRYVNALQPTAHGIDSISKLNMAVRVAENVLTDKLNLNFTVDLPHDSQCTVRIATKDFVQGALPEATAVIFDLDVFTKPSFESRDLGQISDWIEAAHSEEKKLFFGILTEETIRALMEE